MAKLSARNATLYLDDSAGACRALSGFVNTITLTYNAEATEVTGFGNSAREYVPDGIKDWDLSMDGFWANGANETDTVLNGIRTSGGSTLFRLGPAGSVSGCPMYAACGMLTNYDISLGAEDAATISLTLAARSGSLTRSTASW